MNSLRLSFSGAELTRLRNLVADVANEVTVIRQRDRTTPEEREDSSTPLDLTWSRLVEMLDLGPEPAQHECPRCKRLNMLGTTRCETCWSVLPTNAPESATASERSSGGKPLGVSKLK